MTIIEFPMQEPSYWVCSCGCMTHFVRQDGAAECANCGEDGSPEGFYLDLPDGPNREPDDAGLLRLHSLHLHDGSEFAIKRFAERMKAGEFNVIIGIREDGTVGSVAPVMPDTPEQWKWLRRRLREAYELLRGRK